MIGETEWTDVLQNMVEQTKLPIYHTRLLTADRVDSVHSNDSILCVKNVVYELTYTRCILVPANRGHVNSDVWTPRHFADLLFVRLVSGKSCYCP